MELGSLVGVIVGLLCVLLSILIGAGFDFGALLNFFDAPSIMVVFGGTIASTIISVPIKRFVDAMKAAGKVFKPPVIDPAGAIEKIITLANLARKEGLLALEESAREMDDNFLQKGVMLIVDGTDPELTRNILETELAYIEHRHRSAKSVWETLGTLAPSWGMIGTLIGLVLMLQNLSDPDTIGPSMAVALITTFYGSLISNYICNPFASKLSVFSQEEILVKEVLIEGMLSIQAGENPRIIEEKLKAFLAPSLRELMDEKNQKGE